MLRLRPSVRLKDLHPAMVIAAMVVENAYRQVGKDCVITSANDSTHGQGSLHFKGKALDFRIKNLPANQRQAVVANIRDALPVTDFDILWEDVGLDNEHLHVEYQP